MLRFSQTILFFLLTTTFGFTQGKVVLVGGGSEEEGGWSDLPYQWVVDHAANKKIAVVSYTDETEFIPEYFLSLGAIEAINIKIDSKALADLQATYDSLMKFDAFFFKGGDQSYYYNYFKGTKTQAAIIDKFNAGGVMAGTSAGMSILSGVIFTAIHDSVYPDDLLSNFNNSSVTLANDFLPFYPGYLFDTHFTERGRGARLMGFMANWYINKAELLTGIGVDDRTAFSIDENRLGGVYGTGAVSIYNSVSFSSYLTNKPVADSIHVTQLLHGSSINLTTRAITNGPSHFVAPVYSSESENFPVMLSGSEGVSQNGDFFNEFVNEVGESNDTIILVTASGKGTAYKNLLSNKGAVYFVSETTPDSNTPDKIELRNAIRHSRKVLFVENDDVALFNFLQQGPTGTLLSSHIKRNGILSGFIGEDSRFAGAYFVTNHLDYEYNAYYGTLTYQKGLGLLRTSTIMSNTYDASSSDFYENTTAAIPYSMVHDSLKYGIYLDRNSYLKFFQKSGSNYFTSSGQLSTIILTSPGTQTDFESQPVNSAGAVRNYVGFTDMHYTLLNGPSELEVGVPETTIDAPYEFEQLTGVEKAPFLSVYPNPSKSGVFHFSGNFSGLSISSITVTNCVGEIILKNNFLPSGDPATIDLSEFSAGAYILTWFSDGRKFTTLLIKC